MLRFGHSYYLVDGHGEVCVWCLLQREDIEKHNITECVIAAAYPNGE